MLRKICFAAAVISTVALAAAQEINIAIGLGGRPEATTIFDELTDADERAAFRRVWDAQQPGIQLGLVTSFIERYPRSILLREAYELKARAHLATGELASALEWGRRSLRLMPENPFLLVLIADTAVKQGNLDLAATSARDALRHLEHAEAPPAIKPDQWARDRDRLRATALFVLGRVAAHREQFRDAEQSLMASLTLNPDDLEAVYTIAVVRMAVGADEGAARAFAKVASEPGPLSAAARDSLRALYARRDRADGGTTFDDWTSTLKWSAPEPPMAAPAPGEPGRYAGSAACRECHAGIYESWRATGMARMFRAYRSSEIIGDFSGKQTVEGNARAVTDNDKHFIDIRKGDRGEWIRYPVDYVIGSKWQQAYATRLPDSRLLVFPIQYSKRRSEWVNYWKLVDSPGSPRADISSFHDVPASGVYQNTCAPCHTSQLSFPDGAEAPATASFREEGINCEMCHGPSGDHAGRPGGDRTSARGGQAPARFRQLPATQYVAVCAQCHAQSAVHDAQPGGAVNFSSTGAHARTYPMVLPSSFPRRALYRDGRYRATTFISEAFARSDCFRQGGATCGSCHNPHPPDPLTNPNSLKFGEDADTMCVQCHSAYRDNPERHTRHAAGTEASRCVSCHMPRIMEAVLFQARSHEIDEVPDAEMTARFGSTESPNACLGCHRDRDNQWLLTSTAAFKRK